MLVNRSVSSVHFYPDVANCMNNTMSRKALNIKEKKKELKLSDSPGPTPSINDSVTSGKLNGKMYALKQAHSWVPQSQG